MKAVILFFLFTAFHVFAETRISLQFDQSSFKAGELVTAKLTIDANSVQNFPLQAMKGKVLGSTIYFQSISPLIHRENQADYGAEAEVIFIKQPESKELSVTIGTTPTTLSWNEVQVIPVDVPPKFIFMNFDIPSPSKIFIWVGVLLGFLLLGLGLWKLKTKLEMKTQARNVRKKYKEEILSCKTYADVVGLWQKKRIYIQIFPEIEAPFQKMEQVLFKFQFKPTQSDAEQTQAMDAYREFRKAAEGTLSGI